MRAEFNLDAIKAANPIAAVIGRDLALKESSRGEFTACGVRQDAAIGGTFGTGLVSLGAGYDGANATAKWNGNCSELLVYFAALSSADLAAIGNHQKALLRHVIGGVSRTSRYATGCTRKTARRTCSWGRTWAVAFVRRYGAAGGIVNRFAR